MRRLPIAALLGILLSAGAAQGEERLAEALRAIRLADRSERETAVRRALELHPTLAQLRDALRRPPGPAAFVPGLARLEAPDESGTERPYYLFVPRSLAGTTEPAPLVVLLHGGVSRPDFLDDAAFSGLWSRDYYAAWASMAERGRFALLAPLGRADCVWWKPAGTAHLRAAVRDAKRRAPIDDASILVGGFSDGGSGAYYLALAEPDGFAGFFPLNGHPAVASRGSERQLYLRNLRGTPLFCGLTMDDPLYPGGTVLPGLLAAMEEGARLRLVSYPAGGHSPVYVAEQSEALLAFVDECSRATPPERVLWSAEDPAVGRREWIEILETGPAEGDGPEPEDRNPSVVSDRVRLGVRLEERADELRVAAVEPEGLAAAMGIAPGDRIVALDGAPLADRGGLVDALSRKRPGDRVAVAVRRGEETKGLEAAAPAPRPEPLFRRGRPAAHVEARAVANRIEILSRRNVRRLRFHLSLGLFDPAQPVVADGREFPAGGSAETLLDRYARDADAARLVYATVDLAFEPPPR